MVGTTMVAHSVKVVNIDEDFGSSRLAGGACAGLAVAMKASSENLLENSHPMRGRSGV